MLRKWICAAAVAAGLAACSGSGAKLSVSSQAETPPAAGAGPAACPATGITLDEVWLVVRHVEIEGGDLCPAVAQPAGADGACEDDDGDGLEDDCDDDDRDDDGDDDDGGCEAKYGPFAVALSADELASGRVSYEFDFTVPPGTYDELDVLVNTIPAGKAKGDAILEEMAAAHASILVRGKVAGEPFTWTTNVAFEQEREPFTILPEGANVTLELDPSGWFVEVGTCALLDPRDPDVRTEIARNVRASFRLLADDDCDGDDDDEDEDDDD